MSKKIVVIGGGAAGMMAAISAAERGAQEAHGSYGKSEALAVCKAVLCFVDSAVVKRLARALTIAEGKDKSACGEKVIYKEGGNDGYAHTENALQQIC